MAIPQNITKEHIEKAIEEIIPAQIPVQRLEQNYSLISNGKTLPPKYVLSVANKHANGSELNSETFNAVEAKNYLIKLGFNVADKRLEETKSYYMLGASWYGNDDNPDQSERFIENEVWENGYEDKFLDVVKGVNIGDRVAIKSSFATKDRKSILRIKAIGTVYENNGDGRTLKIKWDSRFKPFDLEGYGGYRNTIQKVSKEDIDSIFKQQTNMSFFAELNKFLNQAKTDDLGTTRNSYLQKYLGLDIKISFGQGGAAKIPWISFLGRGQTTSNGIYPVYLYFKAENLLILAYGISVTNDPKNKWPLKNSKTISEYFIENKLGAPFNYGNSFIYKVYNVNQLPTSSLIDSDLNELLTYYNSLDFNEDVKQTTNKMNIDYKSFQQKSIESGLTFSARNVCRFISSLLTKPFVILTGLSGSGKTKLAQAFAMWICESDEQYCVVPVGADWTNREPLLGFPNALLENDYKKDEYGVLNLIIEANANSDKPYFLILDEMNLSHVERYFADFLSVMESKSKISLHSGNVAWNNVPAKIGFPKNLFIIGTVNIDETTYMFSPKVLDRANVIEFRVAKEEMENYLQSNSSINLENLEGLGAAMSGSFVEIAKDDGLEATDTDELNKSLMSFFSELKKTGAEFGYRSASEILRFAAVVNKIEAEWTMTDIIDAAIMQKLLPKVHGSRRRLEPVLKTLGQLCLQDGQKFDDLLITKTEIDFKDATKIKYPVSLEKIIRMYDNLISNGFTSYAEA